MLLHKPTKARPVIGLAAILSFVAISGVLLTALLGQTSQVMALAAPTDNQARAAASDPEAVASVGTSTNSPTSAPTSTSPATYTPVVCGLRWGVVSSPNMGTSNALRKVAVISSTDIWAVGSYSNGSVNQTLTEHWDGATWSIVPSPNVGTNTNFFYGLGAVSTNDVWAVGYYVDGGGVQRTLAEHWDGTQWNVVATPNISAGINDLNGIGIVASNDVWAVGVACDSSTCGGSFNQTLIEHWNGTAWTVVSSPNPSSTNFLYAMTVVAPDNIWAAGYYAGCFACVGFSLIVHWNGAAWSVVSVPDVGPSTDSLYGISAISANDIWAAGHYFTGSRWQTLTLHWNGTAWSAVSSPNSTGDNRLYHVEAIASDDVWAVGEAGRTLALHWNGSAWSIAVTPNIGTGANAFYGVDALASNDVWAVGNAGNQTLIERYQDPCASPTSTPTSTSSPTPTPRLLVGHVVWQGPPSQPNARQQLPITLTLKLGSTEVNYPSQNTDATGHFTVPVSSLASGTYNWRVKGPKHLANSGTVVLSGNPVTTAEMGLMLAGDCDNNNIVNLIDFNIVKLAFGKGLGDPGYDDRADLDNNQLVNIADFSLLKVNYGMAGAPPLRP